MGITGLFPFLLRHAPQSIQSWSIEKCQPHSVLGIDGKSLLYIFNSVHNGDEKQMTKDFLEFAKKMLDQKRIPLFVFDGRAPTAKKHTLLCRQKGREEEKKKKILRKGQFVEAFQQTSGAPLLQETCSELLDEKNVVQSVPGDFEKFFVEKVLSQETKEKCDFLQQLQTITKREATYTGIRSHYIQDLQVLLREHNIPCLQAHTETDFVLVRLLADKTIDYVCSHDSDLLVSLPEDAFLFRFLSRCRFAKEKEEMQEPGLLYSKKMILEALKLTAEQFRDMCILSGCDYVPHHIKGMGPASSYKAILTFANIEKFVEAHPEKHLILSSTFLSEVEDARFHLGHYYSKLTEDWVTLANEIQTSKNRYLLNSLQHEQVPADIPGKTEVTTPNPIEPINEVSST